MRVTVDGRFLEAALKLEKPRLIDPGKQARLTPESKISLTPFE